MTHPRDGVTAAGFLQRRGHTRSDAGSVVAEWSMVAGVMALLFALTVQIIFALHVRNVLIDSASHGARYATLADRGPEDGVERTRELINHTVGPRFSEDISIRSETVNGIPTLEITVRAPMPIVGPFGPAAGLEVTGHAVEYS